jgi:hypothetical protein
VRNQEEHRIQCDFINLARIYLAHTAYIIYANVNESYGGTKKDMIRGAKFKREGRLAGVPDTFLAWARLGFHGLYIEFKAPRGRLSDKQKSVIKALRDAGYCVAVCRDAIDAYGLLKRYTLGSEKDEVMNDWNWK